MSWHDGHDHRVTFPAPAVRHDWFYVYVAWGSDRRRPIYVGKTNRAIERIGRHLAGALWASEVVEFECYGFPTELDALRAESLAIVSLDPIYNVHRSNVGPRSANRPYPKNRKPRVFLRRGEEIPGVSEDQMTIIRRVQNRGRVA